jgi:hypothetical protein
MFFRPSLEAGQTIEDFDQCLLGTADVGFRRLPLKTLERLPRQQQPQQLHVYMRVIHTSPKPAVVLQNE